MNVRCDHIASMPHCGGKSLRRFLGEFVIQPRRLGQQPHPVPLADAFFGSQHDDTRGNLGHARLPLGASTARKRLGMFKIPSSSTRLNCRMLTTYGMLRNDSCANMNR